MHKKILLCHLIPPAAALHGCHGMAGHHCGREPPGESGPRCSLPSMHRACQQNLSFLLYQPLCAPSITARHQHRHRRRHVHTHNHSARIPQSVSCPAPQLRTSNKPPDAQHTEAVVSAVRRARRAVFLTGTPSLSRPYDLFRQVRRSFCSSYHFLVNLSSFEPILSGGSCRVGSWARPQASKEGGGGIESLCCTLCFTLPCISCLLR